MHDGERGAAQHRDDESLPAGNFSTWLRQTRELQRRDGTADVACGSCIGCCTSAYFIHVGPHETQALQRIPPQLLFPAPGLPPGHVLMGYDENGKCPMLADGICSIYEHRPQTCRTFDCRVFPATGLVAGGPQKDIINQRIRRWRFSYPQAADCKEHAAVQAATKFLRQHAGLFPPNFVPGNHAQLAMVAIKVYELFVDRSAELLDLEDHSSNRQLALSIIERLKQFEASRAAAGV